MFFSGVRFFFKKLGLDEGIASWDLKHRIPHVKLRMYWNYEDYRSESRSKYPNIHFCQFHINNRIQQLRSNAWIQVPGRYGEARGDDGKVVS